MRKANTEDLKNILPNMRRSEIVNDFKELRAHLKICIGMIEPAQNTSETQIEVSSKEHGLTAEEHWERIDQNRRDHLRLDRFLCYSAILRLGVLVESKLRLICDQLNIEISPIERERSFEKLAESISRKINFKLESTETNWEIVKDVMHLRHHIAHTDGLLKHSKNRDRAVDLLVRIQKTYGQHGSITIEETGLTLTLPYEIRLSPEVSIYFIGEVESFFVIIADKVATFLQQHQNDNG